MKNLLISFLLLWVFGHTAQNAPVDPKDKKQVATIQNLVNYLDHDTCVDKQFSVVFYVVLDSLYSPIPATQPTLNAMIDQMNLVFKPICVSFLNCSTVYIPNYTYNRWRRTSIEPVVTNNYYTEKTINIYIVDSVKTPNGNEVLGYAYGPNIVPYIPAAPTRSDIVVLEKTYLLNPNFWALFHHLGHFFGLPHTSDEIGTNTSTVTPAPDPTVISYEFADGSNCAEHGDGFCDTEADNNSLTVFKDGKNDFYIPPVDNFMSLNLSGCRYTQQQMSYMARIIARKRLYLH